MQLLRRLPFNPNYLAMLHDSVMAALSFVLALYLRLGDQFHIAKPYLLTGTLLFTGVCMTVFLSMRQYRGLWRYASVQDLIAITKSVTIAILIFFPAMFLLTRLEGMPRSFLLINWLLLTAMLGGPRFLYRIIKDRSLRIDFSSEYMQKIPVLLVGTNDGGELFLREMQRSRHTPYRIIGILGEDKQQIGRWVHNIRIYGNIESLPRVVEKLEKRIARPQKIIVAEHLDAPVMRRLVELSEGQGLSVWQLPDLTDFRSGKDERIDLKPIAIEDLLGRPQRRLNPAIVRKLVEGRRVLVTGAGGTIGSELARQVAAMSPSRLILLDQSEHNLYCIDGELATNYPAVARDVRLADVRDAGHVSNIIGADRPEVVFHAAALKHVPLSERHPAETVLTNIFGTRNVADACKRHGVEAMVLISTDKAVHPTNVMGATKRAAEYYIQALAHADGDTMQTRFITVRFGNVLGSNGSVVPLFRDQLAAGGPLTVTHPDIERYFMTIQEAVELVLQAAAQGRSMQADAGPVFVLDMGEPVRIRDLAVQMIRLAGLRPEEDVQIAYTGLRAGEKLYEELFYTEEDPAPTAAEGVMLAKAIPQQLERVAPLMERLEKAASARNQAECRALLAELVTEYVDSGTKVVPFARIQAA